MPRRKAAPPRGVLTVPLREGQAQHARYHASPDLERYLEHFWVVRWDLRGALPHLAETLPHPSVHMGFADGGGAWIRGVIRGKFSTLLEGKGGVFAAKFRPGGFYPFAQTPVATFTDSVVSLASVWGAGGDELERSVLALEDDDARIAVVENFLRERMPAPDANASLVATIVGTIAADARILTMNDVAGQFSLTARTLQRLFAKYVGVNPKWVIQRYRLHEAAEQLSQGSASHATLALELGYADQAHFVNDFKAVVGAPPAAYAKRARRSDPP
jgi:AraC-like DNA-binding protein